MRSLFDVNVLIAIVDEGHEHHRKAHEWWAAWPQLGKSPE